MHLPYPARKDSNPAPFQPRSSSSRNSGLRFGKDFTLPRRYRQHGIAITVFVLIALVWLFTHGTGSNSHYGGPVGLTDHIPSGSPPAVIVTVLDEARFGAKYTALLKENRKLYAEKHGYETFFPKVGDYDLLSAPNSWTKVVAMRHAMTKFPDATYLWYVDVDAFIMSPHLSIEKDIMATAKLEEQMIVDHPVVPPDSIIHTFSHLRGEDVDFLLTQDKQGLVTSTFILRNSEWSRFLLETWFDPIYRSYNFQKAETHALEHIVQWHPTILSKLALVPQRTINSYSSAARGEEYQTGDLAVRFPSCTKSSKNPTCETEAEPYAMVWRSAFRNG